MKGDRSRGQGSAGWSIHPRQRMGGVAMMSRGACSPQAGRVAGWPIHPRQRIDGAAMMICGRQPISLASVRLGGRCSKGVEHQLLPNNPRW